VIEKEIKITSAKYLKDVISNQTDTILAVINGKEISVPIDDDNRHYQSIKRQVDAGTLTIEAAD
tara:strand:+ start:362 stop:553 length:192 start_codon:yes stop_codon:yes gene_type:complete